MVLIKFRYSDSPSQILVPGDTFDMHDDFIFIGNKNEVVAMVRADAVDGVFVTDKE